MWGQGFFEMPQKNVFVSLVQKLQDTETFAD